MVTRPTEDTPDHLTNARPQDERPQGLNRGGAGGQLALGILNERQEKFAHHLASGMTQVEAATLAGYSGFAANASRLARIPAVEARVKELRLVYQSKSAVKIETAKAEIARLVEKEGVNLTYFIKEYRHNLELARQDGDVKAANDCLRHMAQMMGFLKGASDPVDPGKKNDQHRTQIGIKIENNGAGQGVGSPRVLVEDPDSVIDGLVEEIDEGVS